MIISNLTCDKWLKAVKSQQACHKNIGNQTIQRDSDESSVNSLVFLRPNPCTAGDILFATSKSCISSSRRGEQHQPPLAVKYQWSLSQKWRDTKLISQQVSSAQYHPSSSGAKGGDLMMHWISSKSILLNIRIGAATETCSQESFSEFGEFNPMI